MQHQHRLSSMQVHQKRHRRLPQQLLFAFDTPVNDENKSFIMFTEIVARHSFIQRFVLVIALSVVSTL